MQSLSTDRNPTSTSFQIKMQRCSVDEDNINNIESDRATNRQANFTERALLSSADSKEQAQNGNAEGNNGNDGDN